MTRKRVPTAALDACCSRATDCEKACVAPFGRPRRTQASAWHAITLRVRCRERQQPFPAWSAPEEPRSSGPGERYSRSLQCPGREMSLVNSSGQRDGWHHGRQFPVGKKDATVAIWNKHGTAWAMVTKSIIERNE